MAETLTLTARDKAGRYAELMPQLDALIHGEDNLVATLANVSSALRMAFGFFWVGFYLVDEATETLILGPFQGDIACARIPRGRGVCGHSWAEARTIIVPNVDAFPGHIACSSASRSEIVVPILREGQVLGVIDVDSDLLDEFDEIDAQYLERLSKLLAEKF
ncbi:GAF domain-containing protein [Porphyromonas sp. COT-239 OH1446]|uniref:GAF domain-containing protein n=1 Tax=Porphyromonas sp. COT-239 OH1446 TaxID=1515613 RepID=UPI00052D3CC8|nr:GAF domain-containing protein [Porphyromonas sp. COT-239 OH1446]KGN72195.1 hypothetical protein HQ37_00020 [Porphyromonas sp. COT-239 OH1446]